MTAQAFPLTWPDSWPRTTSPAKSQFKTSLTAAIDNVQGSLKRFSADSGKKVENVLVSSNVSLMERNPKDAGVAVYFTWDGISTCIAVDRYQRIEENLQAIHHVIEAERTKLRHGGLNLVRAAFRGYAALPPPNSGLSNPWEVLGVKEGATTSEIEAAFREKAKKAHPDHQSGSNEQMAKLNAARAELLRRKA
ncbi:J domain-containing protein [Fimbriiglobus ruber]|uniref:DnaJ-class molecular chaperone with C-terminal Zn finger domain n=1 Tax=Fimbriiglobus ruber TaxID=1908690 RepID=A0A225E0D3_9BACT|nr:J domain-containing protein [Fimbriiglobus ruber]OWK42115.1 DnaJ-class molecular chaperone with C-terminal Zn finger domain [Fimbriiglobus ruber]